MGRLLQTLLARLSVAMRRAALGAAGGVLAVVGVVFLTAAGWRALATASGPAAASLVVGAVYLVLGMILFFMASRNDRAARLREAEARAAEAEALRRRTQPAPMDRVMAAFFEGLAAGSSARRRAPPRY